MALLGSLVADHLDKVAISEQIAPAILGDHIRCCTVQQLIFSILADTQQDWSGPEFCLISRVARMRLLSFAIPYGTSSKFATRPGLKPSGRDACVFAPAFHLLQPVRALSA